MKSNRINRLKGMATLIAVIFLTITSVSAQNPGASDMTNEEKARMMTDKQSEKLELNADQKGKMYDLNLKYIKEMQTISAGGRSMSTMMKLRDMSGRKDKEVKKLLEKDQYKQYKKLKKEMQAQMKSKSN